MTRAQAERELQRRVESERAVVRSGLTVERAGRLYLEHLEHVLERKPSTLGDYRSILRAHAVPFFAERPLERLDGDDLRRYIAVKKRDGLATKTITNQLIFLHGLFAFAVKRGWRESNPVAGIDRPRAPRGDPDIRFLDLDELEALLRAVPDDYMGLTDYALRFPRGAAALPPPLMDEIQRARIFEAMCVAIAEEGGFGRMAVTDILDRAGMSNKTFYDYFDNKENCVLAAYDAYGGSLATELASAWSSTEPCFFPAHYPLTRIGSSPMTSHPADHQQPRSRQVPRSPPGRTTFSPEIIDEIQRGRVIDSLAASAAEHGYGGITVERILRHAHMSARTFYALFDNREACLLAAHRVLAARLQVGLEAAWQLEGDWPAKVRAAIAAALAFALREPTAAQFLAAEIQAGGPEAQALQAESIDRLAAKLREGRRLYPAADGLTVPLFAGLSCSKYRIPLSHKLEVDIVKVRAYSSSSYRF